jgi:O-antigen/teichoic acid export membrane protein
VLAKLVSQGTTLVGTLLLARILPVADFGLVAMAQIYLGFLQQFIDAGFLHALIQRPALTQRELAGSFWLLLVAGFLGAGGSVLARGLVDAVFGTPGIGTIIAVQSSLLLFLPFRTVSQAILSREVRIDELSKRETLIATLRVGVSVGLALWGAGVWSLILPQILAEMAFSMSCYRRARWHLTREFSWGDMRPLVRYGIDITLSRIAWFAASRADQFIVGRFLGPTALGLYSLAWQFAGALPQFASATLSRVVFPVFSRLQGRTDQLRAAFLDVTRYTAFVALPALAGLALVAPDLFAIMLRPSWRPGVQPMQLLCPLAFLNVVEATAGAMINARAGTRRNLALNVLSFFAIMVGVSVGAMVGGLTGVAALVGIASTPVTLLFVRAAMRECGGTLGSWLATFKGPATATGAMSAFVAAVDAALATEGHALRLSAMVSVGLIAYTLAVLVVGRDVVANLRRMRQPSYEQGIE